MTTPSTRPLSRRRALAGVTGAGLALPVLAACGDDGGTSTGTTSSATPDAGADPTSASSAAPSESGSDAPAPAPSETTASGVVATSDVPVGGGVVLTDPQVVVTQPAEGEIKVFSSICTHTGCPVNAVADNVITCPCHGSTFDGTTGDVLGGPAPSPLAAVDFTVEGDQVVLT